MGLVGELNPKPSFRVVFVLFLLHGGNRANLALFGNLFYLYVFIFLCLLSSLFPIGFSTAGDNGFYILQKQLSIKTDEKPNIPDLLQANQVERREQLARRDRDVHSSSAGSIRQF